MAVGTATHWNREAAEKNRERMRKAFRKAGAAGRTRAELQEELASRMAPGEIDSVLKYLARHQEIVAGNHEGFGFRWHWVER